MELHLDLIEDKVEFFEARDLKNLEKMVNTQINHNKAILLGVHSVSYQMAMDEHGLRYYSAAVHFKVNKG